MRRPAFDPVTPDPGGRRGDRGRPARFVLWRTFGDGPPARACGRDARVLLRPPHPLDLIDTKSTHSRYTTAAPVSEGGTGCTVAPLPRRGRPQPQSPWPRSPAQPPPRSAPATRRRCARRSARHRRRPWTARRRMRTSVLQGWRFGCSSLRCHARICRSLSGRRCSPTEGLLHGRVTPCLVLVLRGRLLRHHHLHPGDASFLVRRNPDLCGHTAHDLLLLARGAIQTFPPSGP